MTPKPKRFWIIAILILGPLLVFLGITFPRALAIKGVDAPLAPTEVVNLPLLFKGYGTPPQPTATTPPGPTPSPTPTTPQGYAISFGMDTYFVNPERSDNDVNTLSPMAQSIGVQRAREELSWSFVDKWGYNHVDTRIGKMDDDGFEIIGVLVTTPEWARLPECSSNYHCPPSNPQNYANFAGEIAERYDADGNNDAPGSPRIDYWEIWNEPDVQAGTWPIAVDAQRYTQMLCGAYSAIKQADPTAKVLIGGLTGFGNDDYTFMDEVVGYGGWNCFDIMSFHPYFFGHPPEDPDPQYRDQWNFPGRLGRVMDWLNAQGGGKEAWNTEFGWSTCGSGTQCSTTEEQANYLVRGFIVTFATGFNHADYFYIRAKSGGLVTPYLECAVIEGLLDTDPYTPKTSYYAYSVMTDRLEGSNYLGGGPLHSFNDTWADVHDHMFRHPNGTYVDVLWVLQGSDSYQFPVESGVTQVHHYDRSGNHQVLTPAGGIVTVTLSESPIYLVRTPPGQ